MKQLVSALLLAGLAACASGGAVRDVVAGQPFRISPGERVALPDRATLLYAGVLDDSRCPPDVQCIRAGDATVAFDFAPLRGAPQKITLNTDAPASAAIGRWQLRLLELERDHAPLATVQVDAR